MNRFWLDGATICRECGIELDGEDPTAIERTCPTCGYTGSDVTLDVVGARESCPFCDAGDPIAERREDTYREECAESRTLRRSAGGGK